VGKSHPRESGFCRDVMLLDAGGTLRAHYANRGKVFVILRRVSTPFQRR